VWAGGGFFAAPQINDSFAVVHTGGVPDVPVTYENRLVGTTDSNGELLVPSLISYQNNELAVDPWRLPADIEVGQTTKLVRPAGGSGMVVNFDVRAVKAALLTLKDKNGQSIPLGSVATLTGDAGVPVGYDGEAYVADLTKTNILDVTLPDGSHCQVQFGYKPVKGQIPVIGPLVCQ
jgi:outer membrane usher protein